MSTASVLGQMISDNHLQNKVSDVPKADEEQVNVGLILKAAHLLRANPSQPPPAWSSRRTLPSCSLAGNGLTMQNISVDSSAGLQHFVLGSLCFYQLNPQKQSL